MADEEEEMDAEEISARMKRDADRHRRWSAVDELFEAELENYIVGNSQGNPYFDRIENPWPSDHAFSHWLSAFCKCLPDCVTVIWKEDKHNLMVGFRHRGEEHWAWLGWREPRRSMKHIRPKPHKVAKKLLKQFPPIPYVIPE